MTSCLSRTIESESVLRLEPTQNSQMEELFEYDARWESMRHEAPRLQLRSTFFLVSGSIRVRFPKLNNEEYVWQNVDCCIHNIILGTLYFEQYGDQFITCKETDLLCRINYKKANGPTDIQLHSILG